MSKIKIGWAEEIFEFNKPVALIGQFAERISEYTEKPLTVTAMAVESEDGEQMVICGLDLLGVSVALTENLRSHLAGNTVGLDPEKVIFTAIHTHTGPNYLGWGINSTTAGAKSSFRTLIESELPADKKYVESADISENKNITTDEEATEEIISKTVKAVFDAWSKREDASFSNAFGRAVVGMCRRAVYSDGTAQMWGDTQRAVFTELEGGNDSGIELMYVFDKVQKLKGIVVNLACPAQCVQHRLFVSPDFWGEVKVLLRERFGEDIFMLPLCSAAGDQCPVDLIRWVEPESDVNDPNLKRNNPPKRKADPSMFDLAGMKKVGKRIAREIIDIYDEGLDDAQSDVIFKHEVHNMGLPLRNATLKDELDAKKAIKEYLNEKGSEVDFNDAAKLQVHLGILRRMEVQERIELVKTEVHIMRLGSIAIATNPFELFLDYGNQIKARSMAEQTFIVQLANGYEGYLPTQKAEKGGHYSAFISSGTVGHEGGELLVRNTLNYINEMWKEEQ